VQQPSWRVERGVGNLELVEEALNGSKPLGRFQFGKSLRDDLSEMGSETVRLFGVLEGDRSCRKVLEAREGLSQTPVQNRVVAPWW